MYPRSGFRSGATSTKNTLFENHPFANTQNVRDAAGESSCRLGFSGCLKDFACKFPSASSEFSQLIVANSSPYAIVL